jgi:nicotinic acid phosphoribosyltransferase
MSAMVVKFTVAGTLCATAGEIATAAAEKARAAIRCLVTSFSLRSAQLLGARRAGAADKAAGRPRFPGAT